MSAEHWPQPATALTKPADPREQVIAWLIEGNRDADVIESLREQFPHADPAALLSAAVDRFEQSANSRLSVIVGWSLEAYRELYRKALAAGDLEAARKALKELVATAGKYVRDADETEESESSDEAEAADGDGDGT